MQTQILSWLCIPLLISELEKGELEPLGVTYGGNISLQNIHQKLSEADNSILTSSSWMNGRHTPKDLFNKDDRLSGKRRLIISCGPAYSANHNFIKHQCGICIETINDVEKVAQELEDVNTYHRLPD